MELFLNRRAVKLVDAALQNASDLRIEASTLSNGTRLIDCGVQVDGGLQAGILLAKVCLADHAEVEIGSGDRGTWIGPWVEVRSDQPVLACMASQYAGWPAKSGEYFAMASGPMRAKRRREHVLESLALNERSESAVGVLESDKLPDASVADELASQCHTKPENLTLLVAPTRSLAGVVQIVARSVETSLHKLFELGFPLAEIKSAFGTAPLPPPAKDFVKGIGRTNDAMLYGGHVTLYVDSDDKQLSEIGPKVPSNSSRDFGRPFADIFKQYDFDFYKVDAGLFSPAELLFCNLRSGHSFRFGAPRPDLIAKSFG